MKTLIDFDQENSPAEGHASLNAIIDHSDHADRARKQESGCRKHSNTPPPNRSFMKWSLKLGKLLFIDVYLHFTFLLLFAFLGFAYWRTTQKVEAAPLGVAFIVALFCCVVLHELGHALVARRYGIKNRDITRLPIGGSVRLEENPSNQNP